MPENTELKDYGRLLKDGELRIKAHDDQKIKVRSVLARCVLSLPRLLFCFVVTSLNTSFGYHQYQMRFNYMFCFCFRYVFIFDQVMLMCKSVRVSLIISLPTNLHIVPMQQMLSV
jgi:hypothetical protein